MPGDTNHHLYLHATYEIPGGKTSGLLKRTSSGWSTTPFTTRETNVRPGLAYVPSVADPTKGKLYALYIEPNSQIIRMRTSGVVVSTSSGTIVKTPVFGFDAPFDNRAATGWGDLTYASFNDWARIGEKLCSAVANPGNTVANPVPCF